MPIVRSLPIFYISMLQLPLEYLNHACTCILVLYVGSFLENRL